MSPAQLWVFDVFGVIIDSIVVAIAVGVFAYHYRTYKRWQYILLGFAIRYWFAIVLLCLVIYRESLSSILHGISDRVSYEAYVIFALQIVSTVIASYVGMSIGKDSEYLDEKDNQLNYLAGYSMKLWALLTFVYTPVVLLAMRFSIVQIYNLSEKVRSGKYWYSSLTNLLSGDDPYTGVAGIVIGVCVA